LRGFLALAFKMLAKGVHLRNPPEQLRERQRPDLRRRPMQGDR